jgi:hypothetical protein
MTAPKKPGSKSGGKTNKSVFMRVASHLSIAASRYLSKAVSDAVGSKEKPQHRRGCAANIRVPGMTPDQIVRAILAAGLVFDQVIKKFDRWVHISVPSQVDSIPRQLALVIDQHSKSLFV